MPANRFLSIDSGIETLYTAIAASVGAADAGKIPVTDSTGKLDPSLVSGLLSRAIAFSSTVAPADLTGNVIAYDPGLGAAGIWRQGSDTDDRIIRSLLAGTNNQIAIARNIGSSRIILSHEDVADAVAGNRFAIAGNRNFIWYPSQTIILCYISPRWRIAGTHEQQRVSTPAQITADQTDYLATDATTGFTAFHCNILRLSSDAIRTIRSLRGGADTVTREVHNIGNNYLVLPHEDTAGTAANRFDFGGHDRLIAPGEVTVLGYDALSQRWRALDTVKPYKVWARTTSSLTLNNSTAVQRLFNVLTNGAIALPGNSTYRFKCRFDITGMSGTSGNAAFNLLGAGTAVLSNIKYTSYGLDNNTPTNAAALSGLLSNASASAAAIVAAGTGTGLFANIEGEFSIAGAAGTIIPSVALLTAVATAVVSAGAYIEIERIGAGTPAIVGNWS